MSIPGLGAGSPLNAADYRSYRNDVIFHAGKWDPQAADHRVIGDFPLLLEESLWRELSDQAEGLARETLAVESELLARPELHDGLGFGLPLRVALRAGARALAGRDDPRVMRFDFHPTTDGWRITEVNADVPGGYIEAGVMSALAAARFSTGRPPPDPARGIADAFARRLPRGAEIALVHATAYSDDRQVAARIGAVLRETGFAARLCGPDQAGAAAGVFRFFPGEWLTELPFADRWWRWFTSPRRAECNPVSALLVQSKRWPLLLDRLASPCPAWRTLLPPCAEPEPGRMREDGWLAKPAFGRMGEGLAGARTTPEERKRIERDIRRRPRRWIAQRRLTLTPLPTAAGPQHVCLGIYVIDGTASGVYARASGDDIIDWRAHDVPVLITGDARIRGEVIA